MPCRTAEPAARASRAGWPGRHTRLACLLLAALAAACTAAPGPVAPGAGEPTATATPAQVEANEVASPPAATPTLDGWQALLLREPYAFSTPLPPAERTAIDGLYVKVDPKAGTPVPCRRCPDYAPEGGLWKLLLDRGVFRIYHPGTGWRSIGTYAVEGNELVLFNDPVCHTETGRYAWALAEGELALSEVADACGIHLRAENLTKQPWQSCQPPNTEAAISGHWPAPEGCEPEQP